MLVANPGHTPYSLHSKAPNRHGSSRNNATLVHNKSALNTTAAAVAPTAPAYMMAKPAQPPLQPTRIVRITAFESADINPTKTLSIRLNRGTEFSKETVQQKTSKPPSHLSSVLSLNTVPPTNTHRFPDRSATSSTDSLNSEMCHFKPIRTAPTTPNKRSKTSSFLKIPVASIVIPRSKNCDDENRRPKLSSILLISEFSLIHSGNSAFCAVGDPVLCKEFDKNSQSYKKDGIKVKYLNASHQDEQLYNSQLECNKKKTIRKTSVRVTKSEHLNNDKEINPNATSAAAIQRPIRRSVRVARNLDVIPKKQTIIPTTRKRKNPSTEEMPLRKSVRLIKECSSEIATKPSRKQQTKESIVRFSPPLTRSRLKKSVNLRDGAKTNSNQNY